MKVLKIICAIGVAAMVGCGDDDDNNTTFDAPPTTQFDARPPDAGGASFQQPSGTVAVNFTVDDSANKVYTQGDLAWKGSMIYDSTTRKVTYDQAWSGPFAPLYDDGPWTSGGHEPATGVAGDNKWGVTVFITPPATGSQAFGYGLIDTVYEAMGNGWIWRGSDGSFSVAAGATNPITAQGQVMPPFGTTDVRLELDLTAAAGATNGPWDTSVVKIKSSMWGWSNQTVTVANNKATVVLSGLVGPGHTFKHTGLATSGEKPEWNWVLGTGDGKEYKDADMFAHKTGVTAAIKPAGATDFTPVTVQTYAGGTPNKNTYITIP